MAAGQLLHSVEDRVRRRHIFEREITRERSEVQPGRAARVLEEGLELGAEKERVSDFGVIQRLLPEPVARKHELALPLVPERERKHPVQALDACLSVLLVKVDDHFRIRAGRESVAAGFEISSKLPEVVDLAVEDELHRSIFVRDRLITRLEIDDGQAPEAEPYADAIVLLAEKESVVVRPAVAQNCSHRDKGFAIDWPERCYPADSAHACERA